MQEIVFAECCGPPEAAQTGLALTACASRGLAAAYTAGESSRDGAEAAGRSSTLAPSCGSLASPRQDNRADSDRWWPYVQLAGREDWQAKLAEAAAAAARAYKYRLVTNHAVTRTVTHGQQLAITRERHRRRRLHWLQGFTARAVVWLLPHQRQTSATISQGCDGTVATSGGGGGVRLAPYAMAALYQPSGFKFSLTTGTIGGLSYCWKTVT